MRGGSRHHLLRDCPLVAETRTAPLYRLYSVGDRYPALQLASEAAGPAHPGSAIAGEVYDLPLACCATICCPPSRPSWSWAWCSWPAAWTRWA